MRLAEPAWLFLWLGLPIIYWACHSFQLPPRVFFPFSIPQLSTQSSRKLSKPYLLFLLKLVWIAFLIFILARPQGSLQSIERRVDGVDIMMLLDISASMGIEDLGEQSRLETAKDTLQNFIQGRRNDRIGFLIFSGEALTLVPPTLDYPLLHQTIESVKLGTLRDGTAIGDGLAIGVSHLKLSQAKSRIIILLTDGDNNQGQVDPVTAGDLALGYGIRVYTIAIGKDGPAKIPVEMLDPFGRTVKTYQMAHQALNPELLQQIAKKTQGQFYRVIDEKALAQVFQEIDRLEKTEWKVQEQIAYQEKYSFFLVIAIGAWFLLQALERVWWRFAL